MAARASFEAQRPIPTDVLLAGISSDPTAAARGWALPDHHWGDLGGEKPLPRRNKGIWQRLSWWKGSFREDEERGIWEERLKAEAETEGLRSRRDGDLDTEL